MRTGRHLRARPQGETIRIRRTLTATATALALALLCSFLSVAPAGAQADTFVGLINAERSAAGLAPLAVDGSLTAGAEGWAQHMAATGALGHDPNISGSVGGWTKLGENVGTGSNVDVVFGAFMSSTQHRTNILDPAFTHVGVGVAVDNNGQIWVTQRFMRSASGGTTPAPAPAPAPGPAPAPAPAPAPRPSPAPRSTPSPAAPVAPPTTEAPVVDVTTPTAATPARVAIVLDALHEIDR